ncbi:MAG: hypothetical protein IT424_16330 [Pirellulales bacterium]|nr:hypothetical protein [Pirellulales bacterium]
MSAPCGAWRQALVLCLALIAPAWATAQEQTEPERLYDQLQESDEPGAGPLAQRWRSLIRQRIWTDDTGKFKVYARYVDHAADFQSVTLLVMQKNGDKQSFKESVVPLARLGSSDQALVKRIAQVRKEVDEILAGANDASGASVDSQTAGAGEGPRLREEVEGLPAGEAGGPGYEDATGQLPAEPALPPAVMAEPWRNDFAAFAGNLSASLDERGQPTVSWGDLEQLKTVYDLERKLATLRKKPAAQRPPQLELVQLAMTYGWAKGGLGQVAWEATLGGPVSGPGATILHDLVAPEPFSVTLVADEAKPQAYRALKPGAKVRLIGRFTSLGGDGEKPELVLRVRPLTSEKSAAKRRTSVQRRP